MTEAQTRSEFIDHQLARAGWDVKDNFEYFKLNPKGKALTTNVPLRVRLVGLRLDKNEDAFDLSLSRYKTDVFEEV